METVNQVSAAIRSFRAENRGHRIAVYVTNETDMKIRKELYDAGPGIGCEVADGHAFEGWPLFVVKDDPRHPPYRITGSENA